MFYEADYRKRLTAFLFVLLPIAGVACGDSDPQSTATSADATGCVEGRSVECRCSGGERGAQVCLEDGTWGDCNCGTSPPDADVAAAEGSDTEMKDMNGKLDTGLPETSSSNDSGGSDGKDTQPEPEDFRTIRVAAGDRRTFEVAAGETLENLLVDITADGAGVFFDVKGGTLRDVGIKGELPADGTLAHVTAPDPEGEAVVENVYAGDGTDADVGQATAFWVDATDEDAHRGVATFRHVHTADFNDNAIYGSGPGFQLGPDEGGEVHIESCYSYNNNISNFRIGTNGSYVRNSVAVVPPNTNAPRHPNGRNARGVRAIEGATEMVIEDSELFTPDWEAVEVDGAATVRNTSVAGEITGDATTENVDNNVDKSPPPGVPMSAEEAAKGL